MFFANETSILSSGIAETARIVSFLGISPEKPNILYQFCPQSERKSSRINTAYLMLCISASLGGSPSLFSSLTSITVKYVPRPLPVLAKISIPPPYWFEYFDVLWLLALIGVGIPSHIKDAF